ncbi:MAG: hypothetical protein C4318_07975 [Acidimicrobiia bacterium]
MNESLSSQTSDSSEDEDSKGQASEKLDSLPAQNENAVTTGGARQELEEVRRRLNELWTMIDKVVSALESLRNDLASIDKEWNSMLSSSRRPDSPDKEA